MSVPESEYSRYRVRKFFTYVVFAGIVPLVVFIPFAIFMPESTQVYVWTSGIILFVAAIFVTRIYFDPDLTRQEKIVSNN